MGRLCQVVAQTDPGKDPPPRCSTTSVWPSLLCELNAKTPHGSIAQAVALSCDASDAGKKREKKVQEVDVTRRLAHYVAATRWEDVPLQVRHQAKRSLINLFAVALAG